MICDIAFNCINISTQSVHLEKELSVSQSVTDIWYSVKQFSMSGPPSKTPQVLLWEVIFETFWSLGHTVQTVARCQGDDKAPNSSLPLTQRPTGMTLVFCTYRFPCFPGSEMQSIAHSLSFFFKHGISVFFFSPQDRFLTASSVFP